MAFDSTTDRQSEQMGQKKGRRLFLKSGLLGGLGLSLGGYSGLVRALTAGPMQDGAKAQAILHIFLQGGLSHIDTFDPKPYAPIEVRGEFKSISSNVPGVAFSELLARTAKIADKLTIVRSMSHTEAAHERGVHNMLTGYQPSPAVTYPSMGSVVSHELSQVNDLPRYVCIPRAQDPYLGTGYLSSAFGPFSLGSDPGNKNFKVRDLDLPGGVDGARLERRRQLVEEIDRGYEGKSAVDAVEATEEFYQEAYRLIRSKPAREAFNIKAEPNKMRDRYGRTNMGQRLLLARRLVESGVRYVTVMDNGYDHHQNIFRSLRGKMRAFDQGFAALISDLAGRGLLEKTLVLVTSEFGRTPRVNQDRGRDHWPKVFSVALAGGGIRGGHVHGKSSAGGEEVEDNPVSPSDIAATLFHQMGIDPEKKLMSPGDRPIDIVRDGRVIRDLLS